LGLSPEPTGRALCKQLRGLSFLKKRRHSIKANRLRFLSVEALTKNRSSTIIRRSILSHYAAKTFGLNKFFDLNRLA
jgi:hypothetical protein